MPIEKIFNSPNLRAPFRTRTLLIFILRYVVHAFLTKCVKSISKQWKLISHLSFHKTPLTHCTKTPINLRAAFTFTYTEHVPSDVWLFWILHAQLFCVSSCTTLSLSLNTNLFDWISNTILLNGTQYLIQSYLIQSIFYPIKFNWIKSNQ